MKKTFAIIMLILGFFIIYFFQANFFSWFTISSVKPNLFVILVLLVSLFAGAKVGIPFGFFVGIFLDIIIGKTMGASAVMYSLIGLIGGYFDKNFSKDSRITIMLMIMGTTMIYEIGIYIFQIAQLSINFELLPFLKKLLIEVMYNIILTIIFYQLIQKLGYKLEDTFKGNKILTRYF